jgi:hypothetical protein
MAVLSDRLPVAVVVAFCAFSTIRMVSLGHPVMMLQRASPRCVRHRYLVVKTELKTVLKTGRGQIELKPPAFIALRHRSNAPPSPRFHPLPLPLHHSRNRHHWCPNRPPRHTFLAPPQLYIWLPSRLSVWLPS